MTTNWLQKFHTLYIERTEVGQRKTLTCFFKACSCLCIESKGTILKVGCKSKRPRHGRPRELCPFGIKRSLCGIKSYILGVVGYIFWVWKDGMMWD